MRPDLTEELEKQVGMSRREFFGVDDDIEAVGDVARRIDTP